MSKHLKRGLAVVLLIAVAGVLITGCGTFRQQALDAKSHLEEMAQRVQVAEEAAARNAGQILDLELRIETLEATVTKLQSMQPDE